MSELGSIPLWRLKETIEFGSNKTKHLPNGNTIANFDVAFTKKAAKFRISYRQISESTGLNFQNTNDFAIRHRTDIDYNSYLARWKGQIYKVKHIVPDNTKLITYDIISLRNDNKNG